MECVSGFCLISDGNPCDSNQQCAETCISETCQPLSDTNQSCDDSADCVRAELVCSSNECLVQDSYACNSNSECLNICVESICAAQSSVNQPCDPGENSDCQPPLQCFGVVCLLPDGEACMNNDQCYNVCTNDVCGAPQPVLGDCDESADCMGGGFSGLVCYQSTCLLTDSASCTDNDHCINSCIDDSCAPYSLLEGPCDTGDDADCVDSNSVCTSNECLLPDGIDCQANSNCINQCIDGYCNTASALYGPCDFEDNLDCTSPLVCSDNRVCLKDSGESCIDNVECLFTCIEDECNSIQPMGSTCDIGDSDDCLGGIDCGSDGVCGTFIVIHSFIHSVSQSGISHDQ